MGMAGFSLGFIIVSALASFVYFMFLAVVITHIVKNYNFYKWVTLWLSVGTTFIITLAAGMP